jgi:hypothetical protein
VNKKLLREMAKTIHLPVLVDKLLTKVKEAAKVMQFEEMFYLIYLVQYQIKRGIKKKIYPS